MKQFTREFQVLTRGQGLYPFTDEVLAWVASTGIRTGLLTLHCRHTSASLLIQENADPDVPRDIENFFRRQVPEDPSLYRHNDEGPDDMPSHIRTALTQTSLSVPVVSGAPALGAWQGIHLYEHRRAPHRRQVSAHLIGE
jgi:secondary thiamine-phosphate synthase enzyme